MINSHRKGRNGEREARDIAAAHNLNVRLHGIYEQGDMTITLGDEPRQVEIKRKAISLSEAYELLKTNHEIWVRPNNREWLVIRRLVNHLPDYVELGK